MSAVIEVLALAKRYGDVHALEDVSFDVAAGERVAVIGENGAGKTTLLSILAGALEPSSGGVSRTAREVGFAPQQPALYSKLSVRENLELFARLERIESPSAAVAQMLEQTGLLERADEAAGNLSGGNRQRVNVAIALISEPPVLVLDEPSAALDPAQRERLWQFVGARAERGTAVLFSTHNVSEVARHADRVLVLDNGRLLLDDTPRALLERGGEGDRGDLEQALVSFLADRHAHDSAAER